MKRVKQNSLFEPVKQIEESDVFADKIRRGKLAQVTKDFMIKAGLDLSLVKVSKIYMRSK